MTNNITSSHPYVRQLVRAILEYNGVSEKWLRGPLPSLPSLVPELWQDLNRLIQCIWDRPFQRMVIHGDYDADGIDAACIVETAMNMALKKRGRSDAQVKVHLPTRGDGYGVSEVSLEFFKEFQPDIVLTLDCGTSDRPLYEWAAAHPQALVCAVDHHPPLPGFAPPENFVLLNGHNYEVYMSASGLALLTAMAILGTEDVPDDFWCYAAIGTVADLVPINNPENMTIVRGGLHRLNTRKPEWAVALNSGRHTFTPYSFGFIMGPRINAIGRIGGSPQVALDALRGDLKAVAILEAANQKRQKEVSELADIAVQNAGEDSDVLFAVVDAPRGYVGLLASKMVEKYGRPALVAAREPGCDLLTGSARSVKGVHLVDDVLSKVGHLLSRYGGHEMAAGFSLKAEQEDAVREAIRAIKTNVPVDPLRGKYVLNIPTEPVWMAAAAFAVRLTEPHSTGNLEPFFVVKGDLVDVRPMKNGEYAYINVRNSEDSRLTVRISAWCPHEKIARALLPFKKRLVIPDVEVGFRAKHDPTNLNYPYTFSLEWVKVDEENFIFVRDLKDYATKKKTSERFFPGGHGRFSPCPPGL